MKLTPVESIPNRKDRHDLQSIIEEFANGDVKFAKIEFNDHDYKSAVSCRSAFGKAVSVAGHPMKVFLRNGEVFLSKV